MKCSYCRFANAEDARYCQNCGRRLESSCPVCGTLNTLDAKFCKNCGTALQASETAAVPAKLEPVLIPPTGAYSPFVSTPGTRSPTVQPEASVSGERRIVTALFVDVVGSTALAETVDAEDWTHIMNGAFDRFTPTVRRYGGRVMRLLGDALLAIFGAPVAHEDDPQRATYAALDLISAAQSYAREVEEHFGLEFAIRVGLNSGPVVVGEVGSRLAAEYTAMGDAVNLAARLQSAASPMTIYTSQTTYRRIQATFQCIDLGEMAIKGKTRPVRVYQVVGVKDRAQLRRSADGSAGPWIGREAELKALLDLLPAVDAGIGRAVLIVGEAGMGKSRLVREWQAAAAGDERSERFGWLFSQGLSYGDGIPYHLLVSLFYSIAGLLPGAREETARAGLRQVLESLPGLAVEETWPYLAHMLGLPLQGSEQEKVDMQDPQTLQRQYSTALKEVLTAASQLRRLVLVLDDLHWADATSVDLLVRLLPDAARLPLLICCVTRPEPASPGWTLVTAVRQRLGGRLKEISLEPLSGEQSRRLAIELVGAETLPGELSELILPKAEGNPLYIEELTRAIIDKGFLKKNWPGKAGSGGADELEIPPTLQGLLLARIDRLDEDTRHTLRMASVIGPQFSMGVLSQVLPVEAGELHRWLVELEEAGFLQLLKAQEDVEYRFKHPILQEAAYASLLRTERRQLHQVVGEAMERAESARLDELSALLAYHFAAAGDEVRSLQYYTRAGERAFRQFALQEALELYGRAIGLARRAEKKGELASLLRARASVCDRLGRFEPALQDLEEAIQQAQAAGDSSQELNALLETGLLWASRDYQRTGEYYQQALDLARRSGHPASLASSLNQVGNWYANLDDPLQAIQYHQEALDIFQRLEDHRAIAVTYDLLGMASFLGTRSREALAHFKRADELFLQAGDRPARIDALVGQTFPHSYQESRLFARAEISIPDPIKKGRLAVEIARQVGWRAAEAFSHFNLAQLLASKGDYRAGLEEAHMSKQIADEIEHAQWSAGAQIVQAALYNELLAFKQSLEIVLPAFTLAQQLGSVNWSRMAGSVLASAYIGLGQLEQAENLVDTIQDWDTPVTSIGKCECWCIRAELALTRKDVHTAQDILARLEAGLGQDQENQPGIHLYYLGGRVRAAARQYEEAVVDFRQAIDHCRALEFISGLWRSQASLARVYQAMGEQEQAKELREAARQAVTRIIPQVPGGWLRKEFAEKAFAQISGMGL